MRQPLHWGIVMMLGLVPSSATLAADCNGNGLADSMEAASRGLVGTYYTAPDFTTFFDVRIDANIDFDWDIDDPFPPPFPADNFSVRWEGALLSSSDSGMYSFELEHDDGVRLWINDTLLIDDGGATTNQGFIELDADTQYPLRLEYQQGFGNAFVFLRWRTPGQQSFEIIPTESLRPFMDTNDNDVPDGCEFPDCNDNGAADADDIATGRSSDCDGNGTPDECQCDCNDNGLAEPCETGEGLVGQYWFSEDPGLFTRRLFSRIDPIIDFGNDFGPGVPDDDFAIRWTGTVMTTTAGGLYTFITETDDGVRLWVDGEFLIDDWENQPPMTNTAQIMLDANTRYLIRMEYYEAGGDAAVELRWQPPGGADELIPASALGPLGDADGDGLPDDCLIEDCNDNGTPDTIDIAMGRSEDCNGNCVPDECDLLPEPFDEGVAYWRFEAAGGATVIDSGPNGLDGTLNAQPTRVSDVPVTPIPRSGDANSQSLALNWQSATVGGAYSVPDTDGLLSFGDSDFTIEAWVKLEHISNTNGNNQRQWLCQKKPTASADDLLDYGFMVQAGPLGTTGSELAFRFADGTNNSNSSVISSLKITDLDWHFVSIAHDASANTLRFGLDGGFETVSLSKPDFTNGGPLLVAAHQNDSGVNNQFLRGWIDELRISDSVRPAVALLDSEPLGISADCDGNGIPDECDTSIGEDPDCDGNGVPDECDPDCNNNGTPDTCDVLGGTSEDCNANGIPDECDVLAGSSDCNANNVPDECEDCNQNGLADECDIDEGTSEDCQPNGIPDECETAPEFGVYLLEDGSAEVAVRAAGIYTAWLNHFTTEQDFNTIVEIQVLFSFIAPGTPLTLYVWSDPNGDANPTDATVLSSLSTTVPENSVLIAPIPETFVGPDGTSFFIGVIIDSPVTADDFPASLDVSEPNFPGQSWIIGSNVVMDPDDLFKASIEFETIEDAGAPGNWVLRAVGIRSPGDCNLNEVPDDCDIADGTSDDTNNSGVPDECECLGDSNGDGFVDVTDLVEVILNWGPCPPPCDADLNNDGSVDVMDLVTIILNWGTC